MGSSESSKHDSDTASDAESLKGGYRTTESDGSSESSKHGSNSGSDAESSKGGKETTESDGVQKTTLGDQVKGHNDIVEYVNSLKGNGVTHGGMTSKSIQTVLGLKNAPNFHSKHHREYFYSIKTDEMKETTELYREEIDSSSKTVDPKTN